MENPEIQAPETNAVIWRYLDLAKFLSLLDRRCLYFTCLDRLSEFDLFEGHFTKVNHKFMNIKFGQIPEDVKMLHGIKDEKEFNTSVDMAKQILLGVTKMRSFAYVNSWHIKNHESAAMWKIYSSIKEGIAIQSTYQRLVKSLDSYKDHTVMVGKIKYMDYEKEAIPFDNAISPYMRKRKSFEHEDELRALIFNPQPQGQTKEYITVPGLNVPADLETLIENIYVSPNAPSWVLDVVKSITTKFGLKREVRQSDLAISPIY